MVCAGLTSGEDAVQNGKKSLALIQRWIYYRVVAALKKKIENIITKAFGEWTPACRAAAKEIAELMESPGRLMSAMRKTKSGGHNGGRPKKTLEGK